MDINLHIRMNTFFTLTLLGFGLLINRKEIRTRSIPAYTKNIQEGCTRLLYRLLQKLDVKTIAFIL